MSGVAAGMHGAAVAAKEQDKFWDMADALCADDPVSCEADWMRIAGELSLAPEIFQWDTNCAETEAKIMKDRQAGLALGVDGTPVIYVNQRRLQGVVPETVLKEIIREEAGESRVWNIQKGLNHE